MGDIMTPHRWRLAAEPRPAGSELPHGGALKGGRDARALLAGLGADAERAGVLKRCAAPVDGPCFALPGGDGAVDDLVKVGQLALHLRAELLLLLLLCCFNFSLN